MQPTIDEQRAIENLRALIRIPTMSHLDESETDWSQFVAFRNEVAKRYPKLHTALELELVDGHSMLFRWAGLDSSDPTVLMAHYDVVPATEEGWEHPPFAAELVGEPGEQLVWGRGTLDDKGSLVSVLEAVESLVSCGFTPQHDIYLSFGHNEETAGSGAQVIVNLLQALVRLNKKPFRTSFVPTNLEMIRTLGVHTSQPLKWIFTNLWLTKLPLLGLFSRLSDETSAMVRTTQAITQLSGAQAANALAERAEAIVNIRIAIDSTVAEATAHVKRAIRDDSVVIELLHPTEPSAVSPTSGKAWELVKATIEETFAGTIVTPYVMLGASDSRHFTRISDYVYRFSPFEMSTEERGTLHAKNERIRVSTFVKGVAFYTRLVGQL